jgi:hypothetical protein
VGLPEQEVESRSRIKKPVTVLQSLPTSPPQRKHTFELIYNFSSQRSNNVSLFDQTVTA